MLADLRHVVITGAAGAIGSALTTAFASAAPHARFSLVDKNPIDHALVTAGRARALAWDLSNPSALEASYASLGQARDVAPVDALVNCAGVMELVSFAKTPWELGRALLDIDLVSPLRLMSLAVPGMLARGFGLVVNVASLAGLVPLRGSSYYGAAKAGLSMASEIARIELAESGVHVLTVYPGPVTSKLEARARAQLSEARFTSSLAARALPVGDAMRLAEAVVRATEKRAPRVIFPSFYRPTVQWLSLARRLTERFSPRPLA